MNNTFTVAEWKMGEVYETLDKLNRKATKVGMPPVSINITGKRSISVRRDEFCKSITVEVVDFELIGEVLKLQGWTFLGTLDHHSIEGSVLVHTVPGQEVPKHYFTSKPVCDHCNKIRRRTETFVVRHEDGTEKQVGRQCLAEFLGIDPKNAISHLQRIFCIASEFGEDSDFSRGPREEVGFDLVEILGLAHAVIRKDGWVSRKMVQERPELQATSSMVSYLLSPPFGNGREQWERDVKEYSPTDDALAEIPLIREWVREHKDESEYMHNLKAIEQAGVVKYKLLGYACSMVSSYQRAMETLRLRKAHKRVNEWFGNIGDKVELEVQVMGINAIESYYGVTTIFKMLDTEGFTVIWYASGEVDSMKAGQKYKIRGTIKKHDEYKDWKQTVITRVKVLNDLGPAETTVVVLGENNVNKN